MEDLRIVELLLWFAIVMAVVGWVFMLDYRKQNKFLLLKVEGYKNVVLGYMMYRYKDLAKIEKLERERCEDVECHSDFAHVFKEMCVRGEEIERLKKELAVCEFGRGK